MVLLALFDGRIVMIKRTLHPIAWIAWLTAACITLSATRNPLHLLIAVLCIAFTALICSPQAGMFRYAPVIILGSAVINLLTARIGATVLVRLPASWPLVNGNLTLESLVFGIVTGLALSGVFAAFTAAHRAIPTRTLLDLLPVAFAPLAVTITIAVAFVPATLRHLRQVREAQAIRGHRLRGLRDWVALLMPLLIGGLDRALQLAEALAARGFPETIGMQKRMPTILIALGLGMLIGGLLIRQWAGHILGWMLLLGGSVLVAIAIWQTGHAAPKTRYRQVPWMPHDSLVLIAALAVVGVFTLPLPFIDPVALLFSPYPSLALPRFNPLIGMATLGLLGPGVFVVIGKQ